MTPLKDIVIGQLIKMYRIPKRYHRDGIAGEDSITVNLGILVSVVPEFLSSLLLRAGLRESTNRP